MVKVMTRRERFIERAKAAGATAVFCIGMFSINQPSEPDPKIVMAEEAKAIRCIPKDENTTCVMKRRGHYLEAVKHTESTDKQRLLLMSLHNPITN
jgi:hypothetical protein